MPRNPVVDNERLSPFAAWLMRHKERRGVSVQRIADAADIHVSQLHKIIKSYQPQYSQYQRPGVEKTIAIGTFFNDVEGALDAAGYPTRADPTAAHTDPEYDEHEVIDYLRGQPDPVKDKALNILRAAFGEEDARDNAGNIGKRAE